MAHISLAVRGSQRIESFLKKHFNAQGKGLHAIVSSVEEQIPQQTVRHIRYIASVRNKVVHEAAEIDDLEIFSESIDSILSDLQSIIDARKAEEEQHWRDSSRLLGHYQKQEQPVVVITQTPLWAKIIIPVLAFATISSCYSSVGKGGGTVYGYGNSANTELTRLKYTKASLESTVASLRKELKEAQEEAKRAKEVAQKKAALASAQPDKVAAPHVNVINLRDAQEKLNLLGYNAGPPDGLKGPGTRQALTAFQLQNGLPQTGELNTATSTILFSEQAKTSARPVVSGGRSINMLAVAEKTQNDKQRGYAAIDEGIRENLSRASIKIGKVDVDSGNVQVQVGWTIDVASINEQLKEHLKTQSNRRDLEVRNYRQAEHRPYSASLFSSLQKKSAHIVVKVGPKTGRMRIGGGAHCHVTCQFSTSRNPNSFYLKGSRALGGNYPEVIKVQGLSNADLAAIDQVTGWIEWN